LQEKQIKPNLFPNDNTPNNPFICHFYASCNLENVTGTPYYSTALTVPILEAFEYFRDIESYPQRYPNFCKSVYVLERSDDNIVTKEFWNISINNDFGMLLDHHQILIHDFQLLFERYSVCRRQGTILGLICCSNNKEV
jgi:hypothetical protein